MIRGPLRDLWAVLRRFLAHDGLLLAGALSFSFLLCLAPLALLFFSGVGFLLQSEEITAYVLEIVGSLFPGYGSEALAAVALLTRERKVTGLLGGIGLAIFATQLFASVRVAVNVAFQVERRRGPVHGFAFDLLALTVVGVLATAVSAAILAVLALESAAGQVGGAPALPQIRWPRLVALPLLYAALLGVLFFVYRTFPNTSVSSRAAAAAALVVAVAWEAARRAFAAYLTSFGVYGKLYGSFGVIVAALVWLFFSATIFVLGAELAALWSERHRGGPAAGRPAEPPGPAAEPPPRGHPLAWLAAVLVGAALAVFALQNQAPATVRFLGWAAEEVPLAAVALAGLAAGAAGIGLPLWLGRLRLSARLRRLEREGAARAGPGDGPSGPPAAPDGR